jgi:hypothetical protein
MLMKTAILLSGQVRDAKQCFPTLLEHVIDAYDADVFIDTWVPASQVLDHRGKLIQDDLSTEQVLSLYKPKLAMFEDFNTSPFFNRIKNYKIENRTAYDGSHAWETKIENIFYMYYKVWRCFHHMMHYEAINNFRYDRVIRMRFDLAFDSFPVIDVQPGIVYVPAGFNHRGGINDLLSLGTRETMENVCNLFLKLVQYADEGVGFHPESILRTHIDKCGLQINDFELKYKLRGEYV